MQVSANAHVDKDFKLARDEAKADAKAMAKAEVQSGLEPSAGKVYDSA